MSSIQSIILLIICSVCINMSTNAQKCSADFVSSLRRSFGKTESDLEKIRSITDEYLHDNHLSKDYNILYIPEIYATKCGYKHYRNGDGDKERLLCYLNTENLYMEKAIVFNSNEIIGVVWRNNKLKEPFELVHDKNDNAFMKPLVNEIEKIDPDIVFKIFNIPRSYWYVKDNKLFALSYDHTHDEIRNVESHDASTYISTYLSQNDLMFLVTKRPKNWR